MSRTAIVILNYNGVHLLEKFLPTVVAYSYGAEVIIADNASTDNSLSWVRQVYPSMRIIALDQNYGFCGGYNRALREVDADYYLLLNSDIEVTEGWLPPLINILDTRADVSAVQPKILSYHRRNEFEHAGAGGGFIDKLGYPYCRGRIFDTVETDRGQYNDDHFVFWSSGACMLIRARSFHQFGGFDEDYFAHMEEIDLCWKLHRDNQRVMYCGRSVIYHIGAGTLSYGSPRKIFLNFRNGLFVLYKHLSFAQLFTRLPLRVVLDVVAALRFIVSGQWSNGAAIVRAHGEFFLNMGRETRKRRAIQSAYPRYTGEGMKVRSIVYEYFIRRRMTFDQLGDQ